MIGSTNVYGAFLVGSCLLLMMMVSPVSSEGDAAESASTERLFSNNKSEAEVLLDLAKSICEDHNRADLRASAAEFLSKQNTDFNGSLKTAEIYRFIERLCTAASEEVQEIPIKPQSNGPPKESAMLWDYLHYYHNPNEAAESVKLNEEKKYQAGNPKLWWKKETYLNNDVVHESPFLY